MTIYDAARIRLQELDLRKQELEKQVHDAPPGKLSWTKNGPSPDSERWFIINGRQQYLSQKEKELALVMVKKGIAEADLRDIAAEQAGLRSLLRHEKYHFHESYSQKIAKSKKLSTWISEGKEVAWDQVSFETNSYPITKKLRSGKGELVRSKSELLISQALLSHEIPYRYEAGLKLGESTIYPDFTILRPMDHKIIYWEHCGLMDVANYRSRFYEKVEIYAQQGIFLNRNLICTFETEEEPLDFEQIEDLIQRFLLIQPR
ncbi:MAG: hypothetical protein PUC75_02930 [Lachnospiraceae bacterium]|nr:hypothetical protein [Lachnospiraceae bacterium]MDD6449496.1 hypothetical protein [Lachnospiraceae bacterium]